MCPPSSPDLAKIVGDGSCDPRTSKRLLIVSGLCDAFNALGLVGSKYTPPAETVMSGSKRVFEKECQISRSNLRLAQGLCLQILKDLSDRCDQFPMKPTCSCDTCIVCGEVGIDDNSGDDELWF